MQKQRSKQILGCKGFSLLEILVSGAVLAMVLVGLATLTSYTIKSSDQARVRTFAAEFAQSRIDLFRFQRAMIGWGGLSQELATRSYCLNDVSESTSQIDFSQLPTGDHSSCGFEEIPEKDIPALFKQVANVTIDEDNGEIMIEVVVSWQNDKGITVDSRSSFIFRRDSRNTEVFVPVGPTIIAIFPPPQNITHYAWEDEYSTSCIENSYYYYNVYTYNSQGVPGPSSSTMFIQMPPDHNTIRISWNEVVGAAYYRVYMSQDSAMISNVYYNNVPAVSLSVDMTCTGTSGSLPE